MVQIFERVQHLERDLDYTIFRELAAGRPELLFQGVALDILHHQVMAVLLAEAVEDARDMLVIELGEHVGLALKTA